MSIIPDTLSEITNITPAEIFAEGALPDDFRSNAPLDAQRFSYSLYRGFRNGKVPTAQVSDVPWSALVDAITNGGEPERLKDDSPQTKGEAATYILGPVDGKREDGCYKPRAFITLDTDLIRDWWVDMAVDSVAACGLESLVTSSISRGSPDYPNESRCRITIPLDRAVDGDEFRTISRVMSAALFQGRDDHKCHGINQVAGIWVAPEGRWERILNEDFRANSVTCGAPLNVEAVLKFHEDNTALVAETLKEGAWQQKCWGAKKKGEPMPARPGRVASGEGLAGTKPKIAGIDLSINDTLGTSPEPETPENVARLKAMLAAIPPTLPRSDWLGVIWAVIGLGWACGEELVREWSYAGADQYAGVDAREDFENVVRGYAPTGARHTWGTLDHLARKAGWEPSAGHKAEGGEPGSRTSSVILQCLENVQIEKITWLWDGYLAKGKFHLLAGHAGVSKTTVALAMAATVTTGGKWPDGSKAERGNVLIWTGEDDIADTIKPRLVINGADPQRVFSIAAARGEDGKPRPFDPATDMNALRGAAQGIPGGVALLIVDPIVSAVKGDSHKNAEVRRDLQELVDLGAELDCAVLGITHLSKGTKGSRIGERVTGSLAFNALARVVIGCAQMPEGDRDSGRVALFRSKSNIGPDSGGYYYDLDQGPVPGANGIFASKVTWRGPVEDHAEEIMTRSENGRGGQTKGEMATALLLSLLADGPVKAKDIEAEAKHLGISSPTLNRAKNAARIGDSRWGFGTNSLVWWYVHGTLPPDWEERRNKWLQDHPPK